MKRAGDCEVHGPMLYLLASEGRTSTVSKTPLAISRPKVEMGRSRHGLHGRSAKGADQTRLHMHGSDRSPSPPGIYQFRGLGY
jgi:hypothetical protein